MAEEKILIPAYKRSWSCAGCGATVYAPASGGDWPSMSACDCEQGPKIARPETAENQMQRREVKQEERARAA